MSKNENSNLGKKILYSVLIGLCGLVLILNLAGIIGVWAVRGPLSDSAVVIFRVVEDAAKFAQESLTKADLATANLQTAVGEVSRASDQISQNVSDKGLVMTLLPAEREQQLVETTGTVKETYQGIRGSIEAILDLYNSINRLPFVSLPGLSEGQVADIQNAVTQVQTLTDTLRSSIVDFRSGVTTKIDKVSGAASAVNDEISKIRNEIATLQTNLANLEAFSVRMQQVIPGVLTTLAVVVSLLLAFVAYTQVEVIRLYLGRWKSLS